LLDEFIARSLQSRVQAPVLENDEPVASTDASLTSKAAYATPVLPAKGLSKSILPPGRNICRSTRGGRHRALARRGGTPHTPCGAACRQRAQLRIAALACRSVGARAGALLVPHYPAQNVVTNRERGVLDPTWAGVLSHIAARSPDDLYFACFADSASQKRISLPRTPPETGSRSSPDRACPIPPIWRRG
jgi:hypothetical protein